MYIVLAFKYGNKGSPAKKSTNKLGMTLIIPTYNEELIIEKKLHDIFKLDYPPELLEVLIIDSSTDKTPEIVKEFKKKYTCITLILEERQGLAKALNTAYAAAKNEIVIKTDCDSMLDKDVLWKVAANFGDPDVGGVAGKQVVINKSKVEVGYRSIQSMIQVTESWIDSTVIFHPFSAYRKDLVVPIEPDSLADDSELAIKIRKQGYRTIIDPTITYYEASHSSFFKRRKQKDRRGKGLIRLLFQHKDVLFNPKYGLYGMIVYPMNFYMLVLSPYLLLILFFSILLTIFTYSVVGMFGYLVLVIIFMYLGQADKLSVFEPFYSLIDSQISLLVGGISLIFGKKSSGTWEVDKELRDAYI